jgi:hypothetical protein
MKVKFKLEERERKKMLAALDFKEKNNLQESLTKKIANPENIEFCQMILDEFSECKPDYKALSIAIKNPKIGLEERISKNGARDK